MVFIFQTNKLKRKKSSAALQLYDIKTQEMQSCQEK